MFGCYKNVSNKTIHLPARVIPPGQIYDPIYDTELVRAKGYLQRSEQPKTTPKVEPLSPSMTWFLGKAQTTWPKKK